MFSGRKPRPLQFSPIDVIQHSCEGTWAAILGRIYCHTWEGGDQPRWWKMAIDRHCKGEHGRLGTPRQAPSCELQPGCTKIIKSICFPLTCTGSLTTWNPSSHSPLSSTRWITKSVGIRGRESSRSWRTKCQLTSNGLTFDIRDHERDGEDIIHTFVSEMVKIRCKCLDLTRLRCW